ncbi:MAG: DUF853 family protein [Acidimicrobiia bacterium]|nr:DUF853 family protein [Acidimicrobiia bacterium]
MAEFFVGGAIDPTTRERTEGNTTIDSDDFTTHGVIVGMTGSGKTGLGIILIEEVLASGRPVLIVDPKGDLTNLCLTFPELRPEDFRPWIDESQANAAGVSADEFAAQQATTWREGLESWGLGGERIAALREMADFTIYTPGSRSGLSLDLVGSLQKPQTDDEEIIGDEVEGFVSGLLGLVGIEADPLSSREHILLSNLIHDAWSKGVPIDLATLVGMVQTPPLRKLGVFDLDQFFPPADRSKLAMRLNGLLASPSFSAWSQGSALDIESLLYREDHKPRCAIVTTAHLSDEERQFVTSLVLSKLVTWMRRQSGVTDLRAMLYMDEVMGYLPPTENPPTKKPIMTLMKQARAYGVGVVLSTQNPVDIDYKAISNAGTWMIGRLQTERDKARLLDGLSAAAGGVDIDAVGATIAGLDKRQFVLRKAGEDQPEVFTTRWAMSYLRGPLTRDQIATLMGGRSTTSPGTPSAPSPPADATSDQPASPPVAEPIDSAPAAAPGTDPAPAAATDVVTDADAATPAPAPADAASLGDDETPVMPELAAGIPIRYVDPAAPWLATVGAAPGGRRLEPALVARVGIRYDERSAGDLVHTTEYEAVVFPLTAPLDVTRAVAVDYDDRDLVADAPTGAVYRLGATELSKSATFTQAERDLADHLARTMTYELQVNRELKLFSRPGETPDDFAARCAAAAEDRADAEAATLRDKYDAKVAKLKTQIDAAHDRADVVETQAKGSTRDDLLSTAGSVLGGLLRGRGSIGSVLTKAGRTRSRSQTSERRIDEAEGKVSRLNDELTAVEAEATEELSEIAQRWQAVAAQVESMAVTAEKSDVKVIQLVLAWLPVG